MESSVQFERTKIRLNELLDENPSLAVDQAYQLPDDINSNIIKASILIDGGVLLNCHEDVLVGVEIFSDINKLLPNKEDIKYNLANGFHALSKTTHERFPEWYNTTHLNRFKARELFYSVAVSSESCRELKTQAFTNLGNLLWSSYRWVEAYDIYCQALIENPQNGIASAGALKMLRYSYSLDIGHHDLLAAEIETLAGHVRNNLDSIQEFGGTHSVKAILNEISEIPSRDLKLVQSPEDQFEAYIIENNLTLSPTIHRVKHEKNRWDELNIYSVISSADDGYSVPEVFAMFNTMKSDYILSRKLLYDGIKNAVVETGTYSDTLDYANYGVQTSLLTLAQRSALDILDKIAVAILSYFEIKGARRAYFKSAWYKQSKSRSKVQKIHPELQEEIQSGNTALIALMEIASDLSQTGGFLRPKQDARNSSTHRFTVLHEFGAFKTQESECIEHLGFDSFISEAIDTMKLVRSALIYFVQMIDMNVQRRKTEDDSLYLTMDVPFHEYIRETE